MMVLDEAVVVDEVAYREANQLRVVIHLMITLRTIASRGTIESAFSRIAQRNMCVTYVNSDTKQLAAQGTRPIDASQHDYVLLLETRIEGHRSGNRLMVIV